MDLSTLTIDLGLLAFGAAILNGIVGYGFSSTVTPIALLWTTNRLLNPALIAVELGVNTTLLVRERQHIRGTWPRARPAIIGLLPGVLLGTVALAYLAPSNVKVVVYVLLFPLIALQLLGIRRPIPKEQAVSPAVGTGIGFLYSLTTISGPPLALYWRNQGLSKNEFRCAMAQVRVAESSFSIVAYAAFGLFTPASLALIPTLLIPVILGVPIGVYLIRWASADAFGSLVMGVDGLFVSYGLFNVLGQMQWLAAAPNEALLLIMVAITVVLTARSLHDLPALKEATDGLSAGGPDPPYRTQAPPP